MSQIALVTGAFGYTGTYLRQRLQAAGHPVRTLTDHPPAGADQTVQVFPYTFDDEAALTRAFEGVTTFYNTYWVRYAPGGTTYAAGGGEHRGDDRGGSIGPASNGSCTSASPTRDPMSFYAYYRGKAQLEDALTGQRGVATRSCARRCCSAGTTSWSTTSPGCCAGSMSSRSPVTGGTGCARSHVGDLADLCLRLGHRATRTSSSTRSARRRFTFDDLVGTLQPRTVDAVRAGASAAAIVAVPAARLSAC